MTATVQHTQIPPEANDILAAIPASEREALIAHSEYVSLGRRELLIEAESPIRYVFFMVEGIVSVLSVMTDATGVETATIGRDGMTGIEVFHGVDRATEQSMMQVPGFAYRIASDDFRALLPELPGLRDRLGRFAVMMFTFASQNSGCNRKHPVEQRCARWLLTVSENLRRNELDLTHDFVSQMLGVRRATVTDTLTALEERGLITTRRRLITITDVEGLEAITCSCLQVIRAARARLFGNGEETSPLRDVTKSRDGVSVLGEPRG